LICRELWRKGCDAVGVDKIHGAHEPVHAVTKLGVLLPRT
jgi:hypothetical protein